MGKYTVIVSRRADAMLVRHAQFLANVSVPAAKGLAVDFGKILDALEENPFQFPVETEYELPPGQYRKALFCKRYKALVHCRGGKRLSGRCFGLPAGQLKIFEYIVGRGHGRDIRSMSFSANQPERPAGP